MIAANKDVDAFVNNPRLMGMLRSRIVNIFNVPAQDADMVVFHTLSTTVSWWKPGKAMFSTAVFNSLKNVCLNYFRTQKKHGNCEPLDEQNEQVTDMDAPRVLHFKQLLDKVMEKIQDVEDEEQRDILMNILIYNQPYNEVSDNPVAARQYVNRFRKQLQDEFGEEMQW